MLTRPQYEHFPFAWYCSLTPLNKNLRWAYRIEPLILSSRKLQEHRKLSRLLGSLFLDSAPRRAIGSASCLEVPPVHSAGYHLAGADTAPRRAPGARNACWDQALHQTGQGRRSLMAFRSSDPARLIARVVPLSSRAR